jgi:hypothetical protein
MPRLLRLPLAPHFSQILADPAKIRLSHYRRLFRACPGRGGRVAARVHWPVKIGNLTFF